MTSMRLEEWKRSRLKAKADFALIQSSDKSDGRKSKETRPLYTPLVGKDTRGTKRQEWGLS